MIPNAVTMGEIHRQRGYATNRVPLLSGEVPEGCVTFAFVLRGTSGFSRATTGNTGTRFRVQPEHSLILNRIA